MKTVLKIKKEILPILKKHGVIKAAIFGSTARGDAKRSSDIDILVEFKETPSLFAIGGLYADLKDRLKKRPDIVMYSSIDRRLKPFIMRDKIDIL
jgi:hypothetical protein